MAIGAAGDSLPTVNQRFVGLAAALGLIAGGCVFPEAEKIGAGGAGGGAEGAGGPSSGGGGSAQGGGGAGGGAGGGLEGVVTIADAGAVPCVSGTSTQRHLIRTADGIYLAFYFDEASLQDVSVKRSDDAMATWDDADKLGLAPKLHDKQGANLGLDYAQLADGGVIHAAIALRNQDGYYFELHGRATLDESGSPAWEAPQEMGTYALAVTDPPDGPATGITLAGVFDQTGMISPSGQGDYVIAFGADTFASFSYTPLWEPYYLAFGGTATHARAVFAFAGGAVGVEDSNVSPTQGHLKFWAANEAGVTKYESFPGGGDHARFAWGAVVANDEVHTLRALTSHGFDHRVLDATLAVAAGPSLPKNETLAPDAGVFLATGPGPNHITAFTIADDFTIEKAVFDGAAWGDWTVVEAPSGRARSCISGVPTPDSEGRIALAWTEEDHGQYRLMGALVSQ